MPAGGKTSRNHPCPCGSGKKYKRCCLNVAVPAEEAAWRQQRDASQRLTQDLMKFVQRRFADQLGAAWLDFNHDESPPTADEDLAEGQIFVPYFLFDWDPEPPPRRGGRQPRMGLVARSYVAAMGSRLPELEGLILQQATTQPLSFYETVRCDPGKRMLLREVLIGEQTEVLERTASEILRPGDLAYGQLCRLDGVTTLGRLAPLCIPPRMKAEIIELRTILQKKVASRKQGLTSGDLLRFAEEIRGTYLNIRDDLRDPPQLANMDGDPVLFHTLTFRTGSAYTTFEALAPLASGVSKEELLANADLDDDGVLRCVEIPWLKKGNRQIKQWENSILGRLKISGRSLVAEVNSERRATRLRREIEKRLGIFAVHQSTVTQAPQAILRQAERRGAAGSPAGHGSDDPPIDPAVLEHATAEMQRLVESWAYQKIPVLGGRTPIEAVGDPDGKEIVESLLLDWERQNEEQGALGVLCPDIGAIRRLLRLDSSLV